MIRGLLLAVRPHQWVKNLIVFAALVFSRQLRDTEAVLEVLAVFGVFCLGAAGNYLLNDLIDLRRDRLHPRKRNRPIASGLVPVPVAAAAVVALEVSAISLAFLLGTTEGGVPVLGLLVAGYLAVMAAYSLWLKRVVILDVFVIAAGFVIRVLAGATAVGVEASPWLILCTIFLSLFLGFGKRRAELVLLDDKSAKHRRSLAEYSPTFLDQMIGVCTACVVTCYALYTMAEDTVGRFQTKNLVFTVPFVIFGIFRYLYLLHRKDGGGSPTRALLTDVPMLLTVVGWMITVLAIIGLEQAAA